MFTPAPRNRNIDQITLTIISSTSQAPPRCEPLNRDLRPSFAGEFCNLMIANVTMPKNAITAMKSCANPSTDQRPITGMWKPSMEQRAVGLQVDRGEDQERPEHEEVRGAGD